MSVNDPVADMLTRIRNASRIGHETVEMPHSRIKSDLARVLKREGYIADYLTEGHGGKKNLRVYLRYQADRQPVIRGLRRVSTSGLRRYAPARDLPRVKGGMGVALLSTSRGIMTDREARTSRVGGEVLCYVW
jgi:small subunit ribosomal protein S8